MSAEESPWPTTSDIARRKLHKVQVDGRDGPELHLLNPYQIDPAQSLCGMFFNRISLHRSDSSNVRWNGACRFDKI